MTDYVQNKAEYPKTVTSVRSLMINYQHNSTRQYQSQGAVNQLMFTQRKSTGDDESETKDENKKSQRNLVHITCNDCGIKGYYAGNIGYSSQAKLKEDAEAFRKMKRGNMETNSLMVEEETKH